MTLLGFGEVVPGYDIPVLTEREIRAMQTLAVRNDKWTPPIVRTVALEGKGVPELAARGIACLIIDGPGNGSTLADGNGVPSATDSRNAT